MLEYIDFISKRSEIYINGKDRFLSTLGIIFSILSSSVILVIIGYFLSDLLKRKNFQINESTISENLPVLDLNYIPIAASLRVYNGKSVPLNTYEIVSAVFEGYLENGDYNTTLQFGKSILCNNAKKNRYFNYTNGMICMSPGLNKTLYGENGNVVTGFSLPIFIIFKCKNGTFYDEFGYFHNNTNCADQTTIDNYLSQAYLTVEFLDNSINHLNFEPFEFRKKTIIFPLSWSLFRDIIINYQLVDYNSDIGFVFEDVYTNSTYRFFSAETLINTRNYPSGCFAHIKFSMTSEKAVYTRKYMKLQVTLANIGGFTKFILLIAQSIVTFFSEKSYYLYLIDKFYAEENDYLKEQIQFNKAPNIKVQDKINKTDKDKHSEFRSIVGINKENFTNHPQNNEQSDINLQLPEVPINNLENGKNNISLGNKSLHSNKLMEILKKNENIKRIRNSYTIWDLIFILCKRKNENIQKLKIAKKIIKKILSVNELLKINLKLENLFEIVFTADEKKEYEKIKPRRSYTQIPL